MNKAVINHRQRRYRGPHQNIFTMKMSKDAQHRILSHLSSCDFINNDHFLEYVLYTRGAKSDPWGTPTLKEVICALFDITMDINCKLFYIVTSQLNSYSISYFPETFYFIVHNIKTTEGRLIKSQTLNPLIRFIIATT